MVPTAENPVFSDIDEARTYTEEVREHYRHRHGEYRGARTEEQQIIAEVTSEEANLIVDGTMAGILALRGLSMPMDYDSTISLGGHDWADFKSEFSRLLVGFGVLTNRLEREGYIEHSYANMREHDRFKVASVMFSDFLRHNGLRFGVDTAGLQRIKTVRKHDEDGGITTVRILEDKDAARTTRDIAKNMAELGYHSSSAAHPAAKMSPEMYIQLRLRYPEIPKQEFDQIISFYTNAEEELQERE